MMEDVAAKLASLEQREKSNTHGIDLTLQVSAKKLDFVNPANSSFELGAQQKLLSAIVSDRGGRT